LFISDNGPPFINSKTTFLEAGVRLPVLRRVPGQDVALVNQKMIPYIGILPTLLAWAGTELRSKLSASDVKAPVQRGRSMLPIATSSKITGLSPERSKVSRSHTFHEITNYYPTRFLRTARHKYDRNICWKSAGNSISLLLWTFMPAFLLRAYATKSERHIAIFK
jgi:N-sulfoglucosamine sulfohydrolase